MNGEDRAAVLASLAILSDEELDFLLAVIPVLTFGQECIDQVEPGNSFFTTVVSSLGINIRDWWTPDDTFFSLLRRDELERIAIECGASLGVAPLAAYKKKELVAILTAYLARTANGECRDEHEVRGAAWVPNAMRAAPTPTEGS